MGIRAADSLCNLWKITFLLRAFVFPLVKWEPSVGSVDCKVLCTWEGSHNCVAITCMSVILLFFEICQNLNISVTKEQSQCPLWHCFLIFFFLLFYSFMHLNFLLWKLSSIYKNRLLKGVSLYTSIYQLASNYYWLILRHLHSHQLSPPGISSNKYHVILLLDRFCTGAGPVQAQSRTLPVRRPPGSWFAQERFQGWIRVRTKRVLFR